ncbi:MAG: hypothetical protein A3J28_07490 [Acidobacteria bacterium RIFCSPLOWO2_12_FULL_60_22]|nr:MAG: hypothetical protein A3J28_07490 [Acidobacteria bacterium RIFCSPLOWO2_12_FULL_60_22]
MSTLFAEFLREKLEAPVEGFVHVLHSEADPTRRRGHFTVMFARIGPTGTGGAMKPRYIASEKELERFLESIGFTAEAIAKIRLELTRESSVSELVTLAPSAVQRF